MKPYLNVPVALCEYVCHNNEFQAFSAYLGLQICSAGILGLKQANRLLSALPGLSSQPSRRKALKQLINIGWIGFDNNQRVIYIRSMRRICLNMGLSNSKVLRLNQADLQHVKYFIYAALLNAKLIQQQYAIKRQSGRIPVAIKSDATQPGSYPGLGKFGLGLLFKCSPTKALRIKDKCVKLGYIRVYKKSRKIMTLTQADYNMSPYLRDIYPEKRFLLRFRKNHKSGMIEVFEQLKDEILPLMKIKKRGTRRYNGILKVKS
ncbi:MAG: hypothetical protein ACK4YD_03840 [Chitinophagia bacterium]|jgi:hypothetical protein